MAEVVRRLRAEHDLSEIFHYGADAWGARDAIDYIESFGEVWSLLGRHSEIGRTRDDISAGLRSWRHRSHIVFYRIEGCRVIIVRILHAAADPTAEIEVE